MGSKPNKIIFTGGGSAGHVTPNIALINKCKQKGWDVYYVGSKNGIERHLIDIPYFAITTGKLRRYFSWRNVIDPFKILFGMMQAFFLCRKIKPKVMFSKGGFVSFPVVVAAWLNRIPVVIHESDLTPGLANKLSFPFANKICITFTETKNHIKTQEKIVITGTPIREELYTGNANQGRKLCGFDPKKPIILVYCGGLGSIIINKTIRTLLPKLLTNFQVVHICGKNNIDHNICLAGYKQFEYLQPELADVMACADIVVSRAGANTIYELLTLRKPHILIPLSRKASRGDQIHNAKYFANLGLSHIIFESNLTTNSLYKQIIWVNKHNQEIIKKLADFEKQDSINMIYDILSGFFNLGG